MVNKVGRTGEDGTEKGEGRIDEERRGVE